MAPRNHLLSAADRDVAYYIRNRAIRFYATVAVLGLAVGVLIGFLIPV